MTVGQLKTIVTQDLTDSIDASVLLGWLNRGWEYIQQFVVVPGNETTAELTFTAGSAPLPSDFLHFVELAVDGQQYNVEIDFEQRRSYSETAYPFAFYFWGNAIGIVPALTTSGTLAYVKQAALFTADSDVPSCAPLFHPLIAEYAKGLYRQDSREYDKANVHFTNVDNGIERFSKKLHRRVRRKSLAMGDIRDRFPSYP